jgi:hypothetical protein
MSASDINVCLYIEATAKPASLTFHAAEVKGSAIFKLLTHSWIQSA